MCLMMEIFPASYFPYQPRCNHAKVTVSISFPANETAPGNGESSSERQHLDLGCSFRIPASLLSPFLCSKTLQMPPELGVNFSPLLSRTGLLHTQRLRGKRALLSKPPQFPNCSQTNTPTGGKEMETRCVSGRGACQRRFPLGCAEGGGSFPRVFAATQNC